MQFNIYQCLQHIILWLLCVHTKVYFILHTDFVLLRVLQINTRVPAQQSLPKPPVRRPGTLLGPKSEPQKMHHSPLPSPFLREKPGYPCCRVKLSFLSLIVWPKTPPLHSSYSVLHLILYMLKLHCLFSHTGHSSQQEHSSPTHLLALFSSKILSFDLCTLERKENKRLKHWENSTSTKSH